MAVRFTNLLCCSLVIYYSFVNVKILSVLFSNKKSCEKISLKINCLVRYSQQCKDISYSLYFIKKLATDY